MKRLWLLIALLTACSADPDTDGPGAGAGGKGDGTADLRLCAAVRGNGTYVFSHFGAMARLLEDHGEIDAVAGGSSASVTAFFYESMRMSPALTGKSQADRRVYLALMFKSLMGYADDIAASEDAQAFVAAARLAEEIRTTWTANPDDVADTAVRLSAVLSRPEYRALVNPNLLAMVTDLSEPDAMGYASLTYKVQEIVQAGRTVQDFSAFAHDPRIFMREGLVNFDGVAALIARIAEFYAGADPASQPLLAAFLESCAPHSPGRTWRQLATEFPAECEAPLRAALAAYRTHLRAPGFSPALSRLDQPVGRHSASFIATAFLVNEHGSLSRFLDARAQYRAGTDVPLETDFRDVKFGYFVPQAYAGWLGRTLQSAYPGDAKARMAVILGDRVTWRDAMRFSPIEPGLSAIVPVDEDGDGEADRGYIGGWADLHPVQILDAAGCSEVVYVTRLGAETSFVTKARSLEGVPDSERSGVAELLGLTATLQRELYAADNPKSSFSQAIETSTAVWCTDWNSAVEGELDYMFGHSYGALQSRTGHDTSLALNAGESLGGTQGTVPVLRTPLVGCVH